MLGVLDEGGDPIEPMGAVRFDGEPPRSNAARSACAMDVHPGKRCPECGNHAVIRKDGCDFCTACGAAGACG
ncbi:hypothetical protein [Methylococcus capsulatus]|uniref:hypothetical protein n=1 Tax=Methylococcus capsulatus TaxID=414 RepID=UPI001C53353C|nr:hypothetical protein [Methylococcus capsulatus]QXP89646.1 hypothetical protein KW114_11115 [Methylococcus capsulatus]